MSLEVKNDQELSASDSKSMSSEGSDGYESDDFLNPQRIASQKTPTALYGLVVPAGGEIVPLIDDGELPHAIRLTMAAIDVSDGENSTKACTVKVIRRPVFEDDGEDDDDEIDEEEIAMYTDEFVLCTLKPGVIYQQPLDLSFSEGEVVLFTTTGDCDVHLSGNYMTPVDEPNGAYDSEEDEDEDEEYDSEENELLEQLAEEADSEDELDDIDARISELEEAEAEPVKTNKKRRASAEADVEMDQVEEEPKVEKKLSKKERKKLKNAAGEAAAAPAQEEKQTAEDSAKKSVSFSNDTKAPSKTSINGVGIEDRKTGEGPSAKNGSRVSIRYVGKLKNGKMFDSNTKGKPFAFKLGQGEVIKGMEAGLLGMKAGGERRLEIPAAMAYAGQSLPGIPANSDLIFDIKLLKFN